MPVRPRRHHSLRVAGAVLAAVLAAAVVAGCAASVVGGRGSAASTARSSGAPDFPGPSASGGPSGPSGPSGSTASGRFGRTPSTSVIGDPAIADLCSVVGLDTFAPTALTAAFDGQQYPPGCDVDLSKGTEGVLDVETYATSQPGTDAHTTRVESGLTVYVTAYNAIVGDCARDILVSTGLVVHVTAFPLATSKPSSTTVCAATDAMTKDTTAGIAAGKVAKLALAAPTVSALDFCKVTAAAQASTAPLLAGATTANNSPGIACTLKTAAVRLYVTFETFSGAVPADTNAVTVGGHHLFAGRGNTAAYSYFVSIQGRTADGKYEAVAVNSSAVEPAHAPVGYPANTGIALARFLDTAGLR